MGIWLGAFRPRMISLVGSKADGWVPSASWAPPEDLPDFLKRIEDAAISAGRDPGSIRRVYNVGGRIDPQGGGRFAGSAEAWTDELTRLAVDVGMDAFIFWPAGDPMRQVETFAEALERIIEQKITRALRGTRVVLARHRE